MTNPPNAPDQLQLPLEWPTYDHFTVKLAKGEMGDMAVQREHTAKTQFDAENFVDALRALAEGRDNVTWQGEEVDERGLLYGMAPGGTVFEISVVPPFAQGLNSEGLSDA
jgi:hypothetical protein